MKLPKHILMTFLVLFLFCSNSLAAEAVKFGVPPWPGVTVKTEVAAQILQTLGYPCEQLEIGPPIAYNGMANNEVDAFLGAWVPQQNPMLEPLLKKGKVEVAQTNLDDAVISLCVPDYAAKAGVKTFADLDKHADKFKHHIYNIEMGSSMQISMEEIIKDDVVGLGDWEQTNVTTPIMLKEVQSKFNSKEWVAFGCWKPHWMNLLLDMSYLEGVPGTEKFASKSRVETIVRSGLKKDRPQVYRFLKQLTMESVTQSEWIMKYGKKEIPAKDVASEWIAANKATVATWLKGVKAADGSPAMDKINASY